MKPILHHRRSIRLKGYDYSREGLYFVTICVQNRECLFGEIPATDAVGATTRGAPTLGNIIGAFKSITTNEYIRGVNNKYWRPFNKKLWQRNYYEHVIRNETEYARISKYIIENPLKWNNDKLNPKNKDLSELH